MSVSRIAWRIFTYSAALCSVLIITGAAYQYIASQLDRKNYPAPGQLIEVAGNDMHLYCVGEGSPTVVLDAGWGLGVLGWELQMEAVGKTTRVCAYDRPGMGFSEPVYGLTTGQAAERVHELLTKAGIVEPVVLVGASAGGRYNRAYQRRYPEHVLGMVFVDSAHEQAYSRLPEFPIDPIAEHKLCKWLAPIGVTRLLGNHDNIAEGIPLRKETVRQMVRNYYQTHTCATLVDEWETYQNDGEEPPTSLGDLPLTVLEQGRYYSGFSIPKEWAAVGIDNAYLQEMTKGQRTLQAELVALSTNSKHIVVPDSGHGIQFEKPEVVSSAIIEMVEQVLGDQTVSTSVSTQPN